VNTTEISGALTVQNVFANPEVTWRFRPALTAAPLMNHAAPRTVPPVEAANPVLPDSRYQPATWGANRVGEEVDQPSTTSRGTVSHCIALAACGVALSEIDWAWSRNAWNTSRPGAVPDTCRSPPT